MASVPSSEQARLHTSQPQPSSVASSRVSHGLEDGDWPVREEKACYGLFKVRKVGQIIVLAEWEDSAGHKKRIVLGPYW